MSSIVNGTSVVERLPHFTDASHPRSLFAPPSLRAASIRSCSDPSVWMLSFKS